MPTDKTPEDQITEAGAVELDESELDVASGGILPAVQTSELTIGASPSTKPVARYHLENAWPQT